MYTARHFLGKLYQEGESALWGSMMTMISVGSGTVGGMGNEEERYDWAITHELKARVDLYGGIGAFCRDFKLDKRNFGKHVNGRVRNGVLSPNVPRTSTLLGYLARLGVTPNDFFDSVNERFDKSE